LALNASVSWVDEQKGCSFCLSRVASSEVEFTPEPRPYGGLGRGGLKGGGVGLPFEGWFPTLGRGGDVVRCWRPRRGSLERGGDCSVGSKGPQMGHTTELGCGPSVDWASSEPGKDLGAVHEELKESHGVWVQSDDGVVIIGGFVDHQSARRLFPLQDRHRRKMVRLGSP